MAAHYRSENNQTEINTDSILPELLINRGESHHYETTKMYYI